MLAYDAPTAAYMTKGTVSIKFLQDYLETYIANNKAKEVLLIVDACKSGKLAGGMEGIKMTMQALGKEWSGQITKILSAQEGELSLENPKWGGGRGVFSYYFMKGIQGLANRNTDNVITAGELALYLPLKVGDETANSQNPKIDGDAKRQLFTFDNILLADAKKDELIIPAGQMIAANTKKGFADEITPAVADAYAKYNEFVKKGWLLWGEKETDTVNSALHIYNRLLNDPSAIAIRPSLKSSFFAALQKRSQNKLDDYIKGIPDLFTVKDLRTIKEIIFASTMVEKNHILHDYINARALFFNSLQVDDDLQAIKILKSALKLEEDAAYIYNRIGLRFSDAGMTDSAIYYCEKAKELAPKWLFPYNNLAIDYNTLKQYDKALKNCEEGISINPNFGGIYNVMGTVYEKKGELDRALELYNKAIALDSLQSLPYLNASKVLIEKGLAKDALTFAMKSSALDPKSGDAYNEIGRCYQSLYNYDEAIKFYKKAFSLDTTETIYYNNAGNLLYNQHKYEEALLIYKKAITINPQEEETWINLSDTYHALAKRSDAISYYQEYIKSNNNSNYPYLRLAEYYNDNGDKAEALKLYTKALKYNSNLDEVYIAIANTNIELGNFIKGYAFCIKAAEMNVYESYPMLNKAIRENPLILLESYKFYTDSLSPKISNDRYYLHLGDIFFANKQYAKALDFYEKGIAVSNSKLIKIYHQAIKSSIFLKDYKKAIIYSNMAINKYPSNFDTYYLLASIYSLGNDIPNALKYFSLAIDNGFDDPSQTYADANLINLRKSQKFKELMKKNFPNGIK
ncbi:tetratricopeptide repeat protein [Pedobacter frigiditerrae]|uniref:Tetratricopeptide repeat protein n=1 Tax=Pedobacter frigiditerrae TaxID=2530452 RepID=A0A4R0MXQ0_9SPHI|nr:tetratricopeptide repeat protein [Pedobacter frigiditerrae]TCC92035.1 tetratricopeptide repeat protein [Pedobacter frigiditerrae]